MELTGNYRHELKYQIGPADHLALRQRLKAVMQQDLHTGADGRYTIRSVYFDNYRDKALREKVDGVQRREKFRIRYYNEDLSFITLEKKLKHNDLCMKVDAPLTAEDYRRILRAPGPWMLEHPQPLVRELCCKMKTQQLRPRVLVSYVREPYVYAAGNVRVTFDSNIRTSLFQREFLNGALPDIIATDAPGVLYSSGFALTLVGLSLVTTLVIMAVTSNVVLSLGMVGALSIVRFRTAIKEPVEIVFLFWSLAVGIVIGAGMIPLAVIGSAIIAAGMAAAVCLCLCTAAFSSPIAAAAGETGVSMAHNYYLYEAGGKLNLIPWDYNLALGGMGRSNDATSVVNSAIDNVFSGTTFFDTLMADETCHSRYYAYLQQLVSEYINGGGFDAFYTRVRSQIDALVESDPTAFYSYDEYLTAAETLYQVVKLRGQSIQGQLDGTIPSTEAAQRTSDALVDASALDLSTMGYMNSGGGGGFDAPAASETRTAPDVSDGSEHAPPAGFGPSQFSGEGQNADDPQQTAEDAPASGDAASGGRPDPGSFPGSSADASAAIPTDSLLLYALSLLPLTAAPLFALLYRRRPRKQ